MSYEARINLDHNERVAAINLETGEVREKRGNNIPEDKIVFNPSGFAKHYPEAWAYLVDVLTGEELKVVHRLVLRAEYGTNSLRPLSDRIPRKVLAQELGVGKNKITNLLNKFYEIGIYSKASVMEYDGKEVTYWMLNPYLSFTGKLVSRQLVKLFQDTKLAKIVLKKD